jgi:autotransporter-associated beta strand protein
MNKGAVIDASALLSGDGGEVVLWSDITNPNSITIAYGTIYAKGGTISGDGGRVETSGAQLYMGGITIDIYAHAGQSGTWLLDPYDYLINTDAALSISNALADGVIITIKTTSSSSHGIAGSNVTYGDITIEASITKTTSGTSTLIFEAERNIVVKNGVSISSNNGPLNVEFRADYSSSDTDGDGAGIVVFYGSNITTRGGYVTFGSSSLSVANAHGGNFFQSSSRQSITTSGGEVNFYGDTIVSNTVDLTITTSGGAVTFNGLVDSGNFYEFVNKTGSSGSGSWIDARNEANNAEGLSATTYLVTITSKLENQLALIAAVYQGAWIGAYRNLDGATTGDAWKWIDGPEAGLHFVTESASGGATAVNSLYNNFGSGEPNGFSCGSNCESVGQFFGVAGQWNDLGRLTTYSASSNTSPYAVKGYVKETTLSSSDLVINSGVGNITFNRAVGSNKALSDLTVTGAQITASSVAIANSQNLSITNSSASSITGIVSGTLSNLIKSGSGTLTLSATNTYSGITTISEGTLRISADRNLGAVPLSATATSITFNGGTLNTTADITLNTNRGITLTGAGTINTNSGTWLTYGGVIAGAGAITKSGAGTAELFGGNTYSGGTSISSGILSINSDANLGTAPGSVSANSITLNGGVLQVTANINLETKRGITLTANSGLAATSTNRLIYAGVITGDFGLTINGGNQTGTVALVAANSYTGGTSVKAGTLGIYNNGSLGSGTLTFTGNSNLLLGRAITNITNDIVLSANATIDFDTNVEYLVVAGGGGGGGRHGGGGGAGGLLAGNIDVDVASVSVEVGAGGNGSALRSTSSSSAVEPRNGGNSSLSFLNTVADGGGAGGSSSQTPQSGGSGGGSNSSSSGAAGTAGQGNTGGTGVSGATDNGWAGGGGGGAGAAGQSATSSGGNARGGNGGAGLASSISGSQVFYGGGGGGGLSDHLSSTGPAGQGGSGGGGAGGRAANGTNATANTGGGGGAGGHNGSTWAFAGGNGGSGIVIVRYLGADAADGGTETTGSN